jgi:CHAD domain-containing protein
MSAADEIFYMSARQLAELAHDDVGGLKPALEREEASRPFAIRDSFDHSLRLSHRLLVEDGDRVELLSGSGAALIQAATADARFVADFAAGPVRDALADLSPLRALLPVASGVARSGRLLLVDDEGKTRARALLRELEPAGGNAVVLVTLQGVRGYAKALRDLVARIRECGGTALSVGNLYRMIDPDCVVYDPKPAIEVGRDETAFDAATDLISGYLPVARANEAGIVADLDTEFLHDYRIALRKVRSVLSLFKGVYDPDQTLELKARFSALMAPTGRLRDLDVYLLDQQRFFELVPEAMRGGLEAMFGLLGERRAEAQAALAQHLRGKAYGKEIKTLAKLFAKRRKLMPGPNASRASHDFASELIWKRYRRIGRIASGITTTTPDAEIHELRIECKKLRYLMEFFGPVFPQDSLRSLLRSLKKLQDSLGLFNDLAVQQARLLAFSDTLGDEPRKLEIVQSLGALVVVLHQNQAAERERIVAAFADFNGDRTQGTFRRLFHAEKEG